MIYLFLLIYILYFCTKTPQTKNNDAENIVIHEDILEKKLPAVIVVGVKKCGTGSMIEILKMPHRWLDQSIIK
jgi:hypothetical protein